MSARHRKKLRTRTEAAALAQSAAIPWGNHTPEFMPTFTLGQQVSEARRLMGEERWAELNREWDAEQRANAGGREG